MKSRLFAILTIITPIFIAWGLAYLIGSFVSATFDVAAWMPEARVVTAIWGCAFAYALWYRLEVTHARHV